MAGLVYASRQKIVLPAVLHDRPIVVLLLVLGAAFIIVRMFGIVFVFLIGIAFPLAGKS